MTERDYKDVSRWGDGPWRSEPKYGVLRDEATGLRVVINRGSSGAWCGYVGVPETHPAYGMNYYGIPQADADERHARFRAAMVKFKPSKNHEETGRRLLALSDEANNGAPSDEPFPGIGEMIRDVNVHGGLTYSGPAEWLPLAEPLWYFGFDCAHADDFMPGYFFEHKERGAPFSSTIEEECGKFGSQYRTFEYVRNECAELARQLATMNVGMPALAQQIPGKKNDS